MEYIIALLCPPLAVLICRKPRLVVGNLLLTLCLWLPGVLHAWMLVKQDRAERREIKLVREMQSHRISWALKRV